MAVRLGCDKRLLALVCQRFASDEIVAVAGDAPPLEATGSPDYHSVTMNGQLCGADCRIRATQEFALPTL